MPMQYDPVSYGITMPVGDTGGFTVKINWDKLVEGDILLFAIFGDDGDLLCKSVEIVDSKAYIRLCNHDTRISSRVGTSGICASLPTLLAMKTAM